MCLAVSSKQAASNLSFKLLETDRPFAAAMTRSCQGNRALMTSVHKRD